MRGAALFGKLPAHGDFVSRGLSLDTRDRIDGWLSDALARARETYGGTFEERFDRAMPWRCAGPALGGAIAASQDAAGRRFPIVVMAGDPQAAEACEALLYTAIAERWTADRLAGEAGTAPVGRPARWWQVEGDSEIAADFPGDLLVAMLGDRVSA